MTSPTPQEVRKLARQACDGKSRLERQLATSLLVLAMDELRKRCVKLEEALR